MYFVMFDRFCQYLIKIDKVTMGDLRNKGDLSNEKILYQNKNKLMTKKLGIEVWLESASKGQPKLECVLCCMS